MGLSNELSCEAGSLSHHLNTHRIFQSQVLRLYFPALEPWVVGSVSLPSCSFQFICTQMWECTVRQPPPVLVRQLLPCHKSSLPGCLSLPLLLVWRNVCSLSSWLLDFHTVWFSVSSGYFGFFNCCCPFGCMRRHSVSTDSFLIKGS